MEYRLPMAARPGKGRGSSARRKASGCVAPRSSTGDASSTAVPSPEKEAVSGAAVLPLNMAGVDARRLESGEPYSMADLTVSRVAAEGRELTADEERFVRSRVAEEGFSQPASDAPRRARGGRGWQKVKRSLVGMEHRGRQIKPRDFIPTADFHYLDHAREDEEWPEGTTQEDYEGCIREVMESPESAILYSNREGRGGHLAFVMRTPETWKGRRGREWVFCEYSIEGGRWATCFQRRHDPDRIAADPKREEQVWLRRPEVM